VEQKDNKEVNVTTLLESLLKKSNLSQPEIDLLIELYQESQKEKKQRNSKSTIDGIILEEGDYNEGQ
jgi:hypothetical protein